MTTRAMAYLRTSSAANIDGDSAYRQNDAVMAYAAGQRIEVDSCFWDAAVSGADAIETRAGFVALLEHAASADISLVLVEDAGRFARSMIAQELGVLLLASRGIRLVTAGGQDLSDESDPAKVMLRQVYGAFSQYEKAKVVERLRHGRQRVREALGRCEGRKSTGEANPALLRHAKRLARRNPKTGLRRSLRAISAELAALGYVTGNGTNLSADTIRTLVR